MFLKQEIKTCLFCEKVVTVISKPNFECKHCKIYYLVFSHYLYIRFIKEEIEFEYYHSTNVSIKSFSIFDS